MRESHAGLSMLKTYMGCPRRWYIKYGLGWKPKDSDQSPALTLGSAIHDTIEVYLNEGKDVSILEADKIKDPVLRERYLKMFSAWLAYWKEELSLWTILEVEQEHIIKLPNDFPMSLRVDRIMQNNESGFIYIVDTKTTGWSLEGTVQSYMYDAQPLIYHAAIYQNRPEWIPQFRGWLTDVIYQKGKAGAKTLLSEPVYYLESEVNEFLSSMAMVTTDISSGLEVEDPVEQRMMFPAYKGFNCRAFNSVCPYNDICLSNLTNKSDKFVRDDPTFLAKLYQSFEGV